MDLSKNFAAHEFACKCGCGFGTKPGDVNLQLVSGLQAIRDLTGAALHISSGCRCVKYNSRTKGSSKNSQHTLGNAADVFSQHRTPVQIAQIADTLPEFRNGGIGVYIQKGIVHLDVRGWRKRFGDDF